MQDIFCIADILDDLHHGFRVIQQIITNVIN